MLAHLYISHDTFVFNGTDDISQVNNKLLEFYDLLNRTREKEYKNDNKVFFVPEKFLETKMYEDGTTVSDILCNYKKFGKDIFTVFQSIFKHCVKSCASIDDMKEYLSLESEQECNGLLVLNVLKEYDRRVQIMSTVYDWYLFRRYFLAKYPKNENFFTDELKKYYPKLEFHEELSYSIKDVVHTHPHKIVSSLTIIEKHLISDYRDYKGDFVSFLKWFAGKYKFDDVSLEGTKDSKFMFHFRCGLEAYCETHLKMYSDDSKNQNCHCRIYFKKPDFQDTKVYVGSICTHL